MREGIGIAIATTRNIAADFVKNKAKSQINVFSLIQIKEKMQKKIMVKLHVEYMRKRHKKECAMRIANIVKLIPNQSEAVKSLAEQYRKFAKASSEDILGLAETVYVANRELNMRYLEEFYREVGLDPKSGTARKLKEIGEKLTRFQPYLEKLPNTWTTIYVLAKMQDQDFQRVVDSSVLHPFATLKAIEDVVRVRKAGDEESHVQRLHRSQQGRKRFEAKRVRSKAEEPLGRIPCRSRNIDGAQVRARGTVRARRGAPD